MCYLMHDSMLFVVASDNNVVSRDTLFNFGELRKVGKVMISLAIVFPRDTLSVFFRRHYFERCETPTYPRLGRHDRAFAKLGSLLHSVSSDG